MTTVTLNNLGEMPYALEESINRLRVNLGFCGDTIKKVLVVSSVPNEGKSFVSTHLWQSIAAAGSNVVLVDADMRKSVLIDQYDITPKRVNGLVSFLSGKEDLDSVLLKTNQPYGYMILTRNTVANPSLLLENERMRSLMDTLTESFSYVIVDAPPLENVADGLTLAGYCDGVILVVDSQNTPRALVRNSINAINATGCPLLGVVLNKVEGDGTSYYRAGKYGKYKKYGKYGKYGKYSKYAKYERYGPDPSQVQNTEAVIEVAQEDGSAAKTKEEKKKK